MAYPLSIHDNRLLAKTYQGPVYLWDIDKTYLSTRFSSLSGLLRIPIEFAIDKQAIPGMPAVLRGLRRGVHGSVDCVPLYFISASPPFLRNKIEEKMLRDGVEQDGIIFKDWQKTLRQLKPKRLWEQLGFKLSALLSLRHRHLQAQEYLFGDDTEQDALAFHLYAKILKRNIRKIELENILKKAGVATRDRQEIQRLIACLPKRHGGVKKIFIHLEQNSEPKFFRLYGKDLLAVRGAFQMALALYHLKLVDLETVQEAEEALLQSKAYRFNSIAQLKKDAQERRLISAQSFERLKKASKKIKLN